MSSCLRVADNDLKLFVVVCEIICIRCTNYNSICFLVPFIAIELDHSAVKQSLIHYRTSSKFENHFVVLIALASTEKNGSLKGPYLLNNQLSSC
jgi:hypothetical protein